MKKSSLKNFRCACLNFILFSSASFVQAGVTIGQREVVAEHARGPLGIHIISEEKNKRGIIVFGKNGKKSVDGERWYNFDDKTVWSDFDSLPSNINTGLHLSVKHQSNGLVQYSGSYLKWDSSIQRWIAPYREAIDLNDSQSVGSNFVVSGLPGNGVDRTWSAHYAFRAGETIYLTLKRQLTETVLWRGASIKDSTIFESHLIRSNKGSYTSFSYAGKIANKADIEAAIENDKRLPFLYKRLPLYYAANPRCITIKPQKIVCTLRTSADDDDHSRKLNPGDIFEKSTLIRNPDFKDQFNIIKFNEVESGIYDPELEAEYIYKAGISSIPPMLVAISEDAGISWKRKFIADRGGIDSDLAYDANMDILVAAYGGLTYPRKGVAFQYSLDQGASWSSPVNVSYEEGYTDGTTFITDLGSGRFALIYATSPKYLPGTGLDEWVTYSRIITIKP